MSNHTPNKAAIRALVEELEEAAVERGTATFKEIVRTGKFPDNWDEINRDPVAFSDLETGKPIRVILKALTLDEVHHLIKKMEN